MILACHHISKSFLEVPVLKDVTFHLEKGDRAALVGINGAGKTTLLKIITGETEPDEGSVSFAKDTSLGYLAQDQGLTSDHTVEEELLDSCRQLLSMEEEIAAYESKMQTVSESALPALMDAYHSLLDTFTAAGGYSFRSEIRGILTGLGFTRQEWDKPVNTLSGGQKTRVALGKLLIGKPDIIILDEPTNHLDIDSIKFLESFISSYKGTVLIVSHDRYFLDRTVNCVIELDATKGTFFNGNYSAYAEKKKALLEEQKKAYLNNQQQIKHQEEVIAKLKSFNREKSIKRAESREKMLQKMTVVEKPFRIRDDMHLSFVPRIESGRDVMHVENLAKSFGSNHLFGGVTFDVRRGEHIALIGKNGTGKTTMLKILNEMLPADEGFFRLGTNVFTGYYDQAQEVLEPDNTAFEEISDVYPNMTNTEIRNLLASFLFTGDDVFKLIRSLSGGEKGRLSLAKLMLSGSNFLLLDEPTNHLDIISKEILEQALNSFEGTVLYVSHDRYFINRTASRILRLDENGLFDFMGHPSEEVPDRYIGNYDYYIDEMAKLAAADAEAGSVTASSAAGRGPGALTQGTSAEEDWRSQKEKQAKLRKAASDLKKCEDDIEKAESRIAELEELMSLPENYSDHEKLAIYNAEYEEVKSRLETLYKKWEELA